eukprot:4581922-Amphidinium_carterae.1
MAGGSQVLLGFATMLAKQMQTNCFIKASLNPNNAAATIAKHMSQLGLDSERTLEQLCRSWNAKFQSEQVPVEDGADARWVSFKLDIERLNSLGFEAALEAANAHQLLVDCNSEFELIAEVGQDSMGKPVIHAT